jgi:hypothetical protein
MTGGTAAGVEPDARRQGFEIAAQRSRIAWAALEIRPVVNGRDIHIKLLESW